jgi:hypothetical protein
MIGMKRERERERERESKGYEDERAMGRDEERQEGKGL